MRTAALLTIGVTLLGACAHRPPDQALRSTALWAAREAGAPLVACLPIHYTNESDSETGDLLLSGRSNSRGGYDFPSEVLRRYDALAAAGLFRVEQEIRGSGSERFPMRIYRMTSLGQEHFRPPELESLDDPMGTTPRFCYGEFSAVRAFDIYWMEIAGCAEGLQFDLLYTLGNIPAWAQHSALRTEFAESVSGSDAGAVRHRRLTFVKIGERWTRGRLTDAYSHCETRNPTRERRLP
jgi:hypothetical protein